MLLNKTIDTGAGVRDLVACDRCGRGAFLRVSGGERDLCGDCRTSISRQRDGWTPENSHD